MSSKRLPHETRASSRPVCIISGTCRKLTSCVSIFREHPAEEVFVTGTFDSWTKSQKLDRDGDVFSKTVQLEHISDKIYYKVGSLQLSHF